MQIEELFSSLTGLEYLDRSIQARLNVLLSDNIINAKDLSEISNVIGYVIRDGNVQEALKNFNQLDTHLREQTYNVLMDVYKK